MAFFLCAFFVFVSALAGGCTRGQSTFTAGEYDLGMPCRARTSAFRNSNGWECWSQSPRRCRLCRRAIGFCSSGEFHIHLAKGPEGYVFLCFANLLEMFVDVLFTIIILCLFCHRHNSPALAGALPSTKNDHSSLLLYYVSL